MNGYESEVHYVTTEDGYLNLMHRVYKNSTVVEQVDESGHVVIKNKPVVYMQHGLIDSSDTFIIHHKDKAQAFISAEAGYDVWLGNTRGNKYSKQHLWLDPEEYQYWEHSFPEMAKYDMPAFFSYIRNHTHMAPSEKLTYIGHSQGTTQMFYKMAKEPEFVRDNVNLFVALAPFMVPHSFFSTRKFANLLETITPLLNYFKVYELFSTKDTRHFFYNYCGYFTTSCQYWQHYISTQDTTSYDYDRFRVFMGHYPAGSSLQSANHFTQNANADTFQEFDYGPRQNQIKYGSSSPPEIYLDRIKESGIPIAMYVGIDDEMVSMDDTLAIKDVLGDLVVDYGLINGGHMSFFVNKKVDYFTKNAMSWIQKYNPLLN